MNSITITGQLGKDSERRALGDGTPVLSFSVADSQGKDKPAIWWNCSMFGKRADSLQQYLNKGQAVTVVGTASEREWTDKDGMKRKSMDVRVNDVALQGGNRESSSNAPRASAPAKANSGGSSGFDDMDDSVPV
jgi:single-strand DNA-binding protein